jgi:hypothetical protein
MKKLNSYKQVLKNKIIEVEKLRQARASDNASDDSTLIFITAQQSLNCGFKSFALYIF